MDAASRSARFHAWQPPAALGAELGRGKYGVVSAAGEGGVAKVIEVAPRPAPLGGLAAFLKRAGTEGAVPWKRAKQAYREHVVGLLQSLMVVRSLTPHVAMHFGARVEPAPGYCRLTLFMERFEGSLEAHGGELLREDADWRALLFQVASALAALGVLLRVVHNDLYPRNVLFRRLERPAVAVYQLCDASYLLHYRTLFALTDFGICGSPLLDSRMACCPEVSVPSHERPRQFGLWRAPHHVLSYPDLPVFSRDLYLAFKWASQPNERLPRAPGVTRTWAESTLSRMDEHVARFEEARGILTTIREAFGPERSAAERDGRRPSGSELFRFGPEDREALLRDGMKLLESMPFGLPDEPSPAQ